MTRGQDFVKTFLDRVPQELQRPKREKGPNDGDAVFRGAINLTREQEGRLVEHCLQRIRSLEVELGRDQISNPQWWRSAAGQTADNLEQGVYRSFLGRRGLWDMVYRGEMGWRIQAYGGIFSESNMHVPICRRLTQQMIARAQNFFFGTQPWLGIQTVGKDDMERAKIVEQWAKLGFERARAVDVYNQAIELAFIRGECIIKPTWTDRRSYYQDYLTVALDVDREPLLAQDGEYVFEDDAWVEVEVEGRTMWILARDEETWLPDYAEEPDQLVFDVRLLDRQDIEYQGLELGIMRNQDFLCPLNAISIDEADMVVHLADRPAIEIAHQYIEHLKRTGDDSNLPSVLEFLREAGKSGTPYAHQWAQRPELGEANAGNQQSENNDWRDWMPHDRSIIRTAECWVNYPVFDDGILRKIVVLVDLDAKKIISIDFEKRMVPPNCGRPFHAIRINPVDGRWHGLSTMEQFWPLNYSIDLALNRINFANTQAGSFRTIDTSKLVEAEGMRDPRMFGLNAGELYHRKPGVRHEEIYGETPLVNVQQSNLFAVLEYCQQIVQNMSGVTSANDNDTAGLDTSKLATGILHLERMGQELFAPYLGHLSVGLESSAKESVMHMLLHSREGDALLYFDGDEEAVEILYATTPKNFRFNLKILLSRFRSYQQSIQIAAARNLIERYGATLPEVRPALRPLVLRELEIYEVENPAYSLDLIDAVPAPIPPAPGAPPPAAGEIATQSKDRSQAWQ